MKPIFRVVGLGLLGLTVCARAAVAPRSESPPASRAASPVREVIVVVKTHFDIGYTHRVRDIVQYYRTEMIDRAMDIMDQSKHLPVEQQFAWTGPGWVMSKVLEDWPGQTPTRRQRLDEYVKAGKFRIHALPFTLESDACEPEEMVRGFRFSSDLCRKLGLPLSRSGKMTDVPSHGGALATVLAQGGVRFMHIGCNWPSGCVRTPGLFWWEGPDGSRVLTFYSNTYGTCVPPFLPRWYCDRDPLIASTLAPPADWTYPVWPAIIVTPDNSGPPKAEQIRKLFEDAATNLPGIRVRMGTMDDFVEALLREKPEIPVVRGEMPDTWVHGILCDPGGSRMSRETHPRLAAAEALHTQLGLWGEPQRSIASEVDRAYEKLLLYGEHTWGGAASIREFGEAFARLDPRKYADLEASWEDKTDYIRDAARISREILDAGLQVLARRVGPAGSGWVVYNPLPWSRSGSVRVGDDWVWVKDVPPGGYRTVPPPPASVRSMPRTTTERVTLENAFFRVGVDPGRASIVSWVDKRTGREWIDAAAEQGLGTYLNERFTFEQTLKYTLAYQDGRARGFDGTAGDWPHPGMHKPGMISEQVVPYRAAISSRAVAHVGADSVTLRSPADPARHLPATELRVSLSAEEACLDLELTIRDKAKDNWPEADWLCLSFQIARPKFEVHRQLGVIDPATDILPGANRDLFTVGHGVTLTGEDGAGVAICPLDHPLVSLDRPGCWQFSADAAAFTPRRPSVFVNLYNNQWNTNFRYWYPGTWSSRVRLWLFDRSTSPEDRLGVRALEARNPLVAVAAAGGQDASWPSSRPGLIVSRPGVVVTAFGQNPDGAGTLLRVWEMAGTSGELHLTLPQSSTFQFAHPVNLRGEPAGEAVPVVGGRIKTRLGAFAPASWRLE